MPPHAASAASTQPLVERILDHPLNLDAYLGNAVVSLSSSASRTDWVKTDHIDIPLRQRPLSRAIDEVILYTKNCWTPLPPPVPALWLPYRTPETEYPPAPALGLYMQDREFRCCLRYTGSASLSTALPTCMSFPC